MPTSEQSIRVSAKGEFGQLQRGLKDLQGDLKNVLGEIDKGARKGGIFDDSNLHALDLFKKRFKDTMGDLDKQFQKQNDLIDQLTNSMKKANMVEKTEIQDQIKGREKELDLIRKQIIEVERLYKKRADEAGTYEINPGRGSSSSSSSTGSAFAMSAITSGISKITGAVSTIGKFALGLAGIGSMLSMVQEAYQTSYQRQVGSLDLAQRIRGYGFSGTAPDMYKQVADIGRRDRMGYKEEESWAFQNAYTAKGGALAPNQQYGLQKFARGYGLDLTQVGNMVGGVKQLGGTVQPKQFADMIASSIAQSGMVPRILEVMEAHTTLLQNINTSFKDGSSSQILAYQTTLDRIGNANGMTKLTGQQGANIISGFNGIFQPNNDKWQWTGINALQNYNPAKYGNMGLYDLQSSFEDGLANTDNMPAMAQYLKAQSGGNNTVFKRLMQSWLQDGGFNATKRQVTELDQATNGFTAFDKDKITKIMQANSSGDSGSAYDNNRKNEVGQGILDVESMLQKNLGDFGDKYILPAVTTLQTDATHLIDTIMNNQDGIPGIIKAVDELSPLLKDILIGIIALGAINTAGTVIDLVKKFKSFKGGKGGSDVTSEVEDIEEEIGSKKTPSKTTPKSTASEEPEIGSKTTPKSTVPGEPQIGENLKTGKLSFSEDAELGKLSGGNPKVKANLEQIYRSTGDMDAVRHAVSGNATAGDIIDMVSNGDANIAKQLSDHYVKTGSISSTIDKASELTSKGVSSEANIASKIGKNGSKVVEGIAPELSTAGKIAKFGSKAMPFIGAGIDFGVNKLQGDSTGRSLARAGGSLVGGWGGSYLGGRLGAGIGGLFGGAGAIPGAIVGSLFGGIGGSMLGDKYSGKAYDYITGAIDKRKQEEAIAKLQDFADKGKLQVGGLSAQGVQKLQEMSDKGLLKLSSLDTSGTKSLEALGKEGKLSISNLSSEGAKQLKSLQDTGTLKLTSMDTETATKLSEILAKHTSFVTDMTGVFNSIGDWFNKHLGIDGGSSAPDGSSSSGGGGAYTGKYADWINDASKKYGFDPSLIAGIIQTESGFNPKAYNAKSGATGLGQFLASTAKDIGLKDRTDPETSIYAIAKYLRMRVDWAGGDLNKGIMGYGEGTQEYLNKVLKNASKFKNNTKLYADGAPGISIGSDSSSTSGAPDFFGNGLGITPSNAPSSSVIDPSANVYNYLANMFGSGSGTQPTRVSVDVNLTGEGASQLNTATSTQLKNLIASAIEAYKNQQLSMNTTVRG